MSRLSPPGPPPSRAATGPGAGARPPTGRDALRGPPGRRSATEALLGSPGRGPAALLAAIAFVGALTIAAVWLLQARGFTPCELCLKERVPFYVGVPLAAALALSAPRLPPRAVRLGFAVLALLFAGGAVLGAYHAGVEWKLWPGPTGCSGAVAAPADVGDFLKQLDSVAVVRCDEAALRVGGLSLAAWNALLCAALAVAAAFGARRTAA